MKATGIVRRIDELGRVVIPKEIRRQFGISADEGTPLEIFIEDNKIILRPYYPYNDAISEGEEFLSYLNQIPNAATEEEKKIIRNIIDKLNQG